MISALRRFEGRGWQVSEALRGGGNPHLVPASRLGIILLSVCHDAGIAVEDLTGPRRLPPLVRVRHSAMWRLVNEGGANKAQVARLLNRDRATVRHGIRKHEERLRNAAV